jgi:hypothetical protein
MATRSETSRNIRRILLEMAFILFLFYANLLMGQYNLGHSFADKPILVAISNICTVDNLIIGIAAAFVGHVAFDYLRKRV